MANDTASDPSTGASPSTSSAPPHDAAPRDFAGTVQGGSPPPGRTHPRVPDAIERRYLKVGDRYLFPDRTLAFIDDGSRIRVRTENREVMHSVVAIAEARGWRVIELRGTESFRQGMWHEAALRGIEARGYRPTETEILQLERALSREQATHRASGQPLRAISAQGEPEEAPVGNAQTREAQPAADERPDPRGERASEPGSGDGSESSKSFESRPLRDGPRPPINGMLVGAAAAPYKFDPGERMSFYVMVRTEVGDRTVWGADLERALAESASQPRIGDRVVLTQNGTNPVKVRVPTRNDAGELIGEKKIVAQRARWSIEKPERVRDLQRQARMLRTGEVLAEASLDMHPGLASAAAGLKLAEQYARRVTMDEPSQERLVQAIRERMAAAIEQGRTVHLPDRRLVPTHKQVRQRGGRSIEEPIHERL